VRTGRSGAAEQEQDHEKCSQCAKCVHTARRWTPVTSGTGVHKADDFGWENPRRQWQKEYWEKTAGPRTSGPKPWRRRGRLTRRFTPPGVRAGQIELVLRQGELNLFPDNETNFGLRLLWRTTMQKLGRMKSGTPREDTRPTNADCGFEDGDGSPGSRRAGPPATGWWVFFAWGDRPEIGGVR
jgi:hypothetical protein